MAEIYNTNDNRLTCFRGYLFNNRNKYYINKQHKMKIFKTILLGIISLIITINVNAQAPKTAGQKIIYGSNSKAGKYFDNRGFKMYYETYGTGEPLLIIHGQWWFYT